MECWTDRIQVETFYKFAFKFERMLPTSGIPRSNGQRLYMFRRHACWLCVEACEANQGMSLTDEGIGSVSGRIPPTLLLLRQDIVGLSKCCGWYTQFDNSILSNYFVCYGCTWDPVETHIIMRCSAMLFMDSVTYGRLSRTLARSSVWRRDRMTAGCTSILNIRLPVYRAYL